MSLEQLRIFVAVAERQHIARAADTLHLPQSAVSAAIAALETRRGAKLFHRAGRGIALSDAGSLLLREARALLARADAANLVPPEQAGPQRTTLCLQASRTIASYFLPPHLVTFRRAHPTTDIRLAIGTTAEVAAAIREGHAELGFVDDEISDPLLTVEAVAQDNMIVVVGREHPWCQSADVGARDFMDAEWVLREPGAGTRSVFERAMDTFGVPPADLRVAIELPTDESVRAAVQAGLGATAMSASVAAPALEAGLLHHVPFDLPGRILYAVLKSERNASKAAESLLEITKGK